MSQSGRVMWIACLLTHGFLRRDLGWRYPRDDGGGLDQGKHCGSYLGRRIKVFISVKPGGWGYLQRGGVLCSKVVLAGVCRNGGL